MKDLIEQYKILHEAAGPKHSGGEWFPGKSTLPHGKKISPLISETKAVTLLDYGCGKGMQYSKWNVQKNWGGIMPTLYDPGVEEFSNKPVGKFDGVINIDVLEHIEEIDLDATLSEIFSYSNKFVYLAIALFLGNDFLPDGRNMHVTVMPVNWWREKIIPLKPNNIVCEVSWRHSKSKFTNERI